MEKQKQKDTKNKKPHYLHTSLGISDERNLELQEESTQAIEKNVTKETGFTIDKLLLAVKDVPKNTIEALYVGHNVASAMKEYNDPIRQLMRTLKGLKDG